MMNYTILGSLVVTSRPITRQAQILASLKVQSFNDDRTRGYGAWCVKCHNLTRTSYYNELQALFGRLMAGDHESSA